MGALMRSIDWSTTPIGAVTTWSPALCTMVRMLLANRFPLFLWWGPQYVQIYNDASRPILGAKHPRSMGQPAAECWSEIWHVIGPRIDSPDRGGPATWMEDLFLESNRYGSPEETHFTIAYSPVPDETVASGFGGVLATVHEITGKVVGERRVVVLRDMGAHAVEAKTAEEACAIAAESLTTHDKDVPFALIYLLDTDSRCATLAAASGVAAGEAISPRIVGLGGGDWPLAEVLESMAPRVVPDLAGRFGVVPPGPWSDRPTSAVVLPIPSARAHQPAGLFVAGISARLKFDEQYRAFLELVAGQIGTVIANARAYEEEMKRAEALAELDRAKTAFSSNVSHEFRTPLALMPGPVEDAPADPDEPVAPGQRERLETAEGSSLRLLKLVNTLLDSSRIEAGRVQESSEPTDLARRTAELASNLGPATEKAGLRRPRVLWADDDADLRHSVRRLLGERYDVEAVADGEAALAAARARPPDLVLSDVMMPRLDGFGLLEALRASPATRTIPVILLSARAGEESRVEGLEAGADDYLVKPFSARELLARVGAHLEMARVRREAVERITWAFENLTDGLVILDREWRHTYVNAEAERMLGRKRSDLLGTRVWDEFPFVVGSEVERNLRRAAAEQVTCEFEGYNAGSDRWYENYATPTPDGGVAVYFRDITDRRKAEQAVRESEARFRNMADHAPVMIWVTDATGACTYLNDRWCRFTGSTPEQGFGFGWVESVHPDDRDQAFAAFRAANERRATFRFEYRLRRHDGEYRWAIDSAAPRLGPSGEFLGYIGSVLDVTEEKRRQEELRQSEALLAEAQQIAHIGSWSWDLASNEIVWSDEHYRIVGLRPQEVPMTAEWATNYIHPDDREAAWEAIRRANRDREPFECCLRIVREDGAIINAQSRGQSAYDEAGRPVRMSGTIQDVTERTRAEEALHRGALVLANISDSVIATDLEGTITFWNEGATRLFGWTAAEMVGRPYADRFPGPERSWVAEQIRSRAAGTEWAGEFLDYRKDGSRCWIDARVRRVTDQAGRPHGIIEIARDVAERKQIEEALRASEGRLAADLAGMERLQEVSTRLSHDGDMPPLLLEIIDAAIAITAADMGNIQLLDRETGTLRFVASRGFGREFLEHFAAVHGGRAACGAAMSERKRVVVGDVTESLFAGEDQDVMLAAGARAVQSTPLLGRSGQFVGILSTHCRTPRIPSDRDLHVLDLLARQAADWIERTQAAEELRRAKVAAEEANRAKDEFLANVSHEIRTPFGAILGMTELVLDTPMTDDQRQCLETVKSAAESLLDLIDDLLDFSKIEAGRLELDPAPFSLRETLTDTVRTLVVRARAKGLRLVCEVHPDTPDALVGDARRLRQVLLNLIGNAIKFTKEGGVDVRVGGAEGTAPEGEAFLHFAVADTGIGIPPDGRKRIFRAFEQADSSTTRRYGGTGLGLSIAARLVGLMGGTIGAESEPGRGSTFAFTARFGRQPQPSRRDDARRPDVFPETVTTPVAAPLRILVAEDSEFNSRHLERLLTRRGHAVRVATDGREALKLAVDSAFDLLLLDLHMPELDGFQVVRAIRRREQSTGAHLPVIALTARARQEDRERCLAAGMDDHFPKPIREAELLAAIDRVVAVQGASRLVRPDVEAGGSLLDLVTLLAAYGDDADGLRELGHDFRTDAPARIAEVVDALGERDAPRLREAAHKFYGVLSAFSAVAARRASDLEDLAASGRLDEARPLVAWLETMTPELIRQVNALSYERLLTEEEEGADGPDRTVGPDT